MSARTYELAGVMTALSSLIHSGGESFGITTKLRREKFVQRDGTVEDVPVLSGNSIRGRLRDLGMAHCCRALGYGVHDDTGRVDGLPLPAFYFLFSGGALTASDGGKALDLTYARRLRELIPLVGVFGGAVGNQILPGKLIVDKAYPICAEISHLLPEAYRSPEPLSVFGFLQEEMYTRKDDEKNEHLSPLLNAATRHARLEGMSAQALTEAGPQQMMYYVESFAAGTRFYWRVLLTDVTDVEFEAFLTCLAEFSKIPYLGGRSAAGLGHVALTCDNWRRIDSRVQGQGEQIDVPIGSKYRDHLRSHAEDIRHILAEMT